MLVGQEKVVDLVESDHEQAGVRRVLMVDAHGLWWDLLIAQAFVGRE